MVKVLSIDQIVNSENIWINKQQPSSSPYQMTFDLDDLKSFRPFFTIKHPKPDTINSVNQMDIVHVPPNARLMEDMERELQETLKNEFKTWRQENEKGMKTYTRFDQNVSMALKPLLESFEAAKLKMDGFSEDTHRDLWSNHSRLTTLAATKHIHGVPINVAFTA